jgi:hypothetical protein
MARDESPREDLLREATALVERIELAPAGAEEHEHIVAGFRPDGALSIYFGAEPAYHFNSAGELRRAYCRGLLIKAEAGRLVSMQRLRQENEVQLVRHALSDSEQAEFVANMSRQLSDFEQLCRSNTFVKVGQVPVEADVLDRVLNYLAKYRTTTIAKSPRVL